MADHPNPCPIPAWAVAHPFPFTGERLSHGMGQGFGWSAISAPTGSCCPMGWDGFPLPLWWASQLPSCLGRDGGPPSNNTTTTAPPRCGPKLPLSLGVDQSNTGNRMPTGPTAHGTTKAITGTSININTFATLSLLLPPAIDDEGTATH